MPRKKNDWNKPPVIVSVIALVISALGNTLQCRQYGIVNKKADAETVRANTESARADRLEKAKDDWYTNLQGQLEAVDGKIHAVRQSLRIDSVKSTLTDYEESENARRKMQSDLDALEELDKKEEELQGQMNSFIADYK